jgi:HPt (histidine-containing phosphotransfer) domain-containing protein
MNGKTGKPHEDKVAAARARMAELAGKFIERSIGELETMRAAVAALKTGDPRSLGDIRHLAHRMAGTGATLGFETFSDRALDVEQLAERQAPGVAPDAAALGRFEAAMHALENELRALEQRAR